MLAAAHVVHTWADAILCITARTYSPGICQTLVNQATSSTTSTIIYPGDTVPHRTHQSQLLVAAAPGIVVARPRCGQVGRPVGISIPSYPAHVG